MKLFGKDKNTELEAKAEAQVSEELAKDAAGFVLNIEGADADPAQTEAPVQALRGATKTLPDREEIREAVEAAAGKTEPEAASALKEKAEEEAVPAEEQAETTEDEPAPEKEAEAPAAPAEEPLSSVSYASVAQAVVNAKKEPTGRFERDAVDDETLLAELYALIGDAKPKAAEPAPKAEPAPVQPSPVARPEVRITPETLQDAPEEYVEIEEDTSGVPGWLKGIFILLISLLLSAMTFYAVASDVFGEIF